MHTLQSAIRNGCDWLVFFFSSISIFDEWRDAGSRTSKDILKIDLFGEGLEHALSNSITWSHHMMVF